MFNIISRLQCLKTCLSSTAISQLNVIVTALLAMTGRVTMLGISRWAGEGGSYRTVQRFFNTPIAWAKVHWCLIRHCFLSSDDVFVIAGDETVVTKSGKITYGTVSYTHLRAHETRHDLVCRLLLEKKKEHTQTSPPQ